eukprot:1443162-Ditylum_brightwellii.AAC.1
MINKCKFIPVVNKFCYLGSMITTDLKDSKDVDACTRKASKAFSSLYQGLEHYSQGPVQSPMFPRTMCKNNLQSNL